MEPRKLNFIEGWESKIFEMKGMQTKAVDADEYEIPAGTPVRSDRLRAIYRLKGWNAYWEARQRWMLTHQNVTCAPYDIRADYIRLGQVDVAFPYLNRAVDQKCWASTWIMVDPLVEKIRSDRRYNELLRRMNLPH
jgi:hypothetical protein